MNPKRVAGDAPDLGEGGGFFHSFLMHGAPPLVRLRHAVADFTADDRLDDPFLDGLLSELRGAGPDPSLDHARSWLLRSRSLPGRSSERIADWRSALGALAAGTTPLAELWLDTRDALVLPATQYRRLRGFDRDDLALFPPCAALLVGRHDTLHLVRGQGVDAPPVEGEPRLHSSDFARWEDDFAAWSKRSRGRVARAADWSTALGGHVRDPVILSAGETPWGTAWRDLDRLLGGVWLALRRAAVSRESVSIASGEQLVPVGAGVCLALDVRRHPRRDGSRDVRAAFRTTLGAHGDFSSPTRHTGATGAPADASEPGWELPRGIYASGADVAITVRFAFLPWLAEASGVELMRLATRGNEGVEGIPCA